MRDKIEIAKAMLEDTLVPFFYIDKGYRGYFSHEGCIGTIYLNLMVENPTLDIFIGSIGSSVGTINIEALDEFDFGHPENCLFTDEEKAEEFVELLNKKEQKKINEESN